MHEQLGALEAGAPRDDVRDRIIDAYLGRRLDRGGGIAKELHAASTWSLPPAAALEDERREASAFAIGELRLGEPGEVVARQRGEERVVRIAGLDLTSPGCSRGRRARHLR